MEGGRVLLRCHQQQTNFPLKLATTRSLGYGGGGNCLLKYHSNVKFRIQQSFSDVRVRSDSVFVLSRGRLFSWGGRLIHPLPYPPVPHHFLSTSGKKLNQNCTKVWKPDQLGWQTNTHDSVQPLLPVSTLQLVEELVEQG